MMIKGNKREWPWRGGDRSGRRVAMWRVAGSSCARRAHPGWSWCLCVAFGATVCFGLLLAARWTAEPASTLPSCLGRAVVVPASLAQGSCDSSGREKIGRLPRGAVVIRAIALWQGNHVFCTSRQSGTLRWVGWAEPISGWRQRVGVPHPPPGHTTLLCFTWAVDKRASDEHYSLSALRHHY